MKSITKKNILMLVAGLFIIAQFFRIDKTNPNVEPAKDFIALTQPPLEVENMLRSACYDCHSHETSYPWYSNLAPVSWWLKNHVNEGREHLNFSVWADYNAKKADHKLEECFEEVAKEGMPLKSYPLTHPEARLSEEQRAKLVTWFKQTRQQLNYQKEESK